MSKATAIELERQKANYKVLESVFKKQLELIRQLEVENANLRSDLTKALKKDFDQTG